MKCSIFDVDVSSLTSQQLKERCSGCLEHTGGTYCSHLTIEKEMPTTTFRIAIPTHKRSHLIESLTLNMLLDNRVHFGLIDLFVSSEEEAKSYGKTKVNVVYQKPLNSLTEKFNFIHSYYPVGTNVVVIEDDISAVKSLAGHNKLETTTNLQEEFIRAFLQCQASGSKLWGISSNSNPFFMNAAPSVGYKFICANVYGFIMDNPPVLCECETKTDYERTILYYKRYGGVVRLDYLCPITKNYKTEGGIGADGRKEAEERSVALLASKYPEYCKRNEKKESMYPEITLRYDATLVRNTDTMRQPSIDDLLA